ncbi:MAG: hypothetical protein GVY16_04725 [Planctomycetes bacterium]|jgi:Skp family chaperone for outer membrane proteins|nr:hypothetical protein [Phycisphaerae bacterium]NBB95026.1 hypothetical protein [Planctomycetota bacterium]
MKCNTISVALAAAFIATGGCEPTNVSYRGLTPQMTPMNDETEVRQVAHLDDESIVGDVNTDGRGATDVALEWADKYAKISQKLVYADRRNRELEKEKAQLNQRITELEGELKRTKSELADANVMLEEMKRDLNDWRKNVLAYRKEIRMSQTAQLNALQKILELLGGEVQTGSAGRSANRK